MPVVDKEALQKILLQLLQVIKEIRDFIPSNNISPDAPKLLPRAVSKLPPAPPNHIKMPHVPGAQKQCKLCGVSNHKQRYMANIVFYPCMHCVVCQDCWKEFYAFPGTDGRTSLLVREKNLQCQADKCKVKIQKGIALKSYQDEKREDEVKFS